MKWYVHEDDFFIVHDALVLMTAKETIKWTKEKNCFHRWLLTMNVLQDGTPYAGSPVGNSPEFMTLDNSLNIDILQSLRFHCVLSRFFARRGGKRRGREEYALQFLYTKGNRPRNEAYMIIKMGTPSLARIIEDVDLALKALEIVYLENGASVEVLADRNGHKRKVVGEGEIVGELHGKNLRGTSEKSPKICSCTVIC